MLTGPTSSGSGSIRLGNLTLTGYNSKYSDRPFAEKKTISGGFEESSVRLNKYIREQAQWTPVQMKDRGKLLAQRGAHDLAAARGRSCPGPGRRGRGHATACQEAGCWQGRDDRGSPRALSNSFARGSSRSTATSSSSQNLALSAITDQSSSSKFCPARTASIFSSPSTSTKPRTLTASPRTPRSASSSSTPSTMAACTSQSGVPTILRSPCRSSGRHTL